MQSARGVSLIEFALVLPMLLLLTFITTEFGRALYQYNTITKSVRDAARYLSIQDPSIKLTDPAKVLAARRLVVYGSPNASNAATPLALGLSLAQVPDSNITWKSAGATPAINTVTIKVSGYKFKPLFKSAFGLSLGDVSGEIPFGNISATMRAPS